MQATELGLGASASDAGLWKVGFEYGELDANGNIDEGKNTGNIARQTLTVPGTSFVQSYRYDSLYRIKEAKETTGSNTNWIQNWDYDRYGNRIGFTQNIAGITTAPNPSIDTDSNRFNLNQGFSYDKNGNVTSNVDPITSLNRAFIFNGDNKQSHKAIGVRPALLRFSAVIRPRLNHGSLIVGRRFGRLEKYSGLSHPPKK
jgi:hypothetical protein